MTTLLQRFGTRLHELHIEPRGAGVYFVRWGDIETYAHSDGDELDIIKAAGLAVERRINEATT